jgi:hypothetical protein
MKRNGWKSKHRAFFVACLCAGTSLLVRAESHSIDNGKKAEIKGVIVSRSGDLVKIQGKKTGEIDLSNWEMAQSLSVRGDCIRFFVMLTWMSPPLCQVSPSRQ